MEYLYKNKNRSLIETSGCYNYTLYCDENAGLHTTPSDKPDSDSRKYLRQSLHKWIFV